MTNLGNGAGGVNEVCRAAMEAYAAGLCVVPPAEDGSKRPLPNAKGRWEHYKTTRPTEQELVGWYGARTGLGIITGEVSGYVEVWDFDDRPTYEAFVRAATACGLGAIVERLEAGYVDDTPGGGVRWLARYPAEVERQCDRIILARRPKVESEKSGPQDKIKTLIELPAFTIVAPTNGSVHPTGKPYVRRAGTFSSIPSYTAEERDALIELARSFDAMPRKSAEPGPSASKGTEGARPGDQYNREMTWARLLEPKGWTNVFTRNGTKYWRRPGKKVGISATTNYGGADLLSVFSTSTFFDIETSYSKFGAYAELYHGGSFSAAARQLAREGYGEKSRRRTRDESRKEKADRAERRAAGEEEAEPRSKVDPDIIKTEYRIANGGIEWLHRTKYDDVWVTLTNFTARIVVDITLDDDVETSKVFEIEAALFGRTTQFTIPAHQFASLNWAAEKLGARAIVQPGQMVARRAAVGIQVLSGEIPESKVFAHSGWRQIGDEWLFLHAGGALGSQGPQTDIRVSLPRELSRYRFPDIVEETLSADIEASLGLRRIAPARIMMPGLAAVYRAVIGGSDMSLHYSGLTGVFKSECLALLLQHFGPSMDARHLPAAWSATENRLELLASLAKDVLLGIDDFVLPANATAQDRARLIAKADRVLRAQGNISARGRLRADLTMRPDRPPRGLIASTGEETPAGASLRARMAIAEVRTDDINEEELTIAQRQAAAGVYARALAGFIRWLAPQLDEVQADFKMMREERRQQLEASHKRSSDVFAQLSSAWSVFLRFAREIGAVGEPECSAIEVEVGKAIEELIAEQKELQASSDPIARFRDLIRAALVAGKAHVANAAALKGHCRPDNAEKWGWRAKQLATETIWQAQGDCIGWVDKDGLYLVVEVAFDIARRMGGGDFSVTAETLLRRMADRKLILTIDKRGGRRRLQVRKTIAGARQTVLHVSHTITGPLAWESGPRGPSDPEPEEDQEDQGVT